jgi:hypothetical protein
MMFFFPPSVDLKHWNILLASKHWIIFKKLNIETFPWSSNIRFDALPSPGLNPLEGSTM